jgi:hypothetical protein
MEPIDELRRALGDSPVTIDAVESALGADGVLELRRRYFPRWRRSRANAAAESLRGFKALVVEDEFERKVVRALVPRELTVKVRVSKHEAKLAREARAVAEVRAAS